MRAHSVTFVGIDWSVYLIIDGGKRSLEEMLALLDAAVNGGVAVVQYRDKYRSFDDRLQAAHELLRGCRKSGIVLLINDDVEIARLCGADGVHLGAADMPVPAAREILGASAIIGRSVDTVDELVDVRSLPLDYLAVGPVFPTSSKADVPKPIGTKGLSEVRAAWAGTLIAIGGIDPSNVKSVAATGVDGVAVISAVADAANPESAIGELRSAWRSGRSSVLEGRCA